MNRHISTTVGSALLGASLLLALVLITTSVDKIESTVRTTSPHNQLAQISGAGSGLVAHYTFDEGSGTTASDSVGSNTGTLNNNPSWTTGKIGGALNFTAGDQSVQAVGQSSGSTNITGNQLTIAAWVNSPLSVFNSDSTHLTIFFKGTTSSGYRLMLETSGSIIAQVSNGASSYNSSSSSSKCSANTWCHIVYVYDGTNAKSYFDGVQNSTVQAASGNLVSSALDPLVGTSLTRSGSSSYHFNGLLDDVRVYNRALSATEVAELYAYTGGTTTPPPPTTDITPPSISNIQSSSITTSAATITWTTDESADTQVEYGLTTGYGNTTSLNSSLVTSHSQSLSSLTANTTYHYRVRSKDAAGNTTVSGDQTVTTSADVVVTPTTPPSTPTVTDPVGWWKLDEGSSTTASDSSSNSSVGSISGSVYLPQWVSGKSGSALNFSDSSQYVNIGNAAPLSLTGNQISISVWVNPAFNFFLDDAGTIISKAGSSAGYRMMITNKGRVSFQLGTVGSITSSTRVPENQWSYVAGIYDGSSLSVYVNGVKDSVTLSATTNISNTTSSVIIGSSSTGSNHFSYHFNGLIDDVRVYNRALSASEISSIYTSFGSNNTITPPTISSVSSSATASSATVTWNTDQSADSEVEYSISSGSYSNHTNLNTSSITSHNVSITGLSPLTTYYYRVSSRNAAGARAVSSENTFTTAAVVGVEPTLSEGAPSGTLPQNAKETLLAVKTDVNSTCRYGTSPNTSYASLPNKFLTTGYRVHSAVFSNLVNGSSYNIYVRCADTSGNVNTSDYQISFSVAPTVTSGTGTTYTVKQAGGGNFTTIQACANAVRAGDTCSVYPGNYSERVSTKIAGTSNNYITFQAVGTAVIRGFDITHNYVKVDGFEVTNTDNSGCSSSITNQGIYIQGDYDVVTNNYIHDINNWAIFGYSRSTSREVIGSYVANNRTYKNQSGMFIRGTNWVVQNNEVVRNFQYCSSSDSDYSRFIGQSHTWSNNYYHGSAEADLINAHMDCFQNYDNDGSNSVTNNILVKNNMCLDYMQAAELEEMNLYSKKSGNLVFLNNVFARGVNPQLYTAFLSHMPYAHFIGNTLAQMGAGVMGISDIYGLGSLYTTVKNNIFSDFGPYSFTINPAEPTIYENYNLEISKSGTQSLGSGYVRGINDITTNPLFTNPTNPVGPDNIPFTADDGLRLQSSSPACTGGEGGTYIGAYSCSGSSLPSTYTVTATTIGSGTVTATGLTCTSNTCTATVTNGSTITLTATANTGSTFTGWSGSCTGTSTCTLSGAGTVTATFNTTVTPDTTLPTVSLTSPSGTVSGIVTLGATASDNVGVVGLQFKLDGVNIGQELTTAPYTGAWNTIGIADGTHTLTAVARDAAGNSKTSNPVSIIINNNTAPVLSSIGSKTVVAGTQLSFSILATDAQNNTLTYTAPLLPLGASFSNRTFTWTPVTPGTYSARFNVSDGSLSDSETISITVTAPLPVDQDTDGDGVSNANDKCPLTPPELRNEVNLYGCPKPRATKFTVVPDPATTDISSTLPSLDISNAYGKITYATPVALYRDQTTYKTQLDVDSYLDITPGKVSLGSSSLPELNKAATITLYNITYQQPKILRDGTVCTTCTLISYSNNTYVFRVTGFSTYSIEEGAQTTTTTTTSSPGGGGTTTTTTTYPTTGTLTPTVTQIPISTASTTQAIANTISPYSGLTLLTRNLYKGLRGEDVRNLQKFLVIEGLLTIDEPTTYFGTQTEAAVKLYQAKNNIVSSGDPATTGYGAVGPKTRDSINQKIGITTPQQQSSTITLNLYKGLNHPQVATLQTFLKQQGYLSIDSVTTYYGPLTEEAVQKLQCAKLSICSGTPESNGYGFVGPKTRGVIK